MNRVFLHKVNLASNLLIFLMCALPIVSKAQNLVEKKVIVNKYPQIVPSGKVWVLKAGSQIKVQVSTGALRSGTLCNASLMSNPHIVASINRGDYSSSIGYGIFCKNLKKNNFDNEYVFDIIPTAFFDRSFRLSQLEYSSPEEIGISELRFNSGESVYVSNCLEAIELIEVNSTKNILGSNNTTGTGVVESPAIVDRTLLKRILTDEPLVILLGSSREKVNDWIKSYSILQNNYSNIKIGKSLNDTAYNLKFDSRNICNEVIKSIEVENENIAEKQIDSIKIVFNNLGFKEQRVPASGGYGQLGYFNTFLVSNRLYVCPTKSETLSSTGDKKVYIDIIYINSLFKRMDSY